MATILDPNPQGTAGGSVSLDSDQGYKYPYGLDLRPGSKLHQRILQEVNNRAKDSSAEMSKRFPSWKKIDRSLTAYVPADTYESALQVLDERKPISIVIPYTYATLETLLTYFVAAFLESPIFKFEGNSPEDIVGAFLMERIVDTHCNNFKVALSLHTMFRDAFAYGIGPVATTWETKWGFKETVKEQGFFSQVLGRFLNMGQETSRERTVLAEGNALKNLDPYLTLLDPNVAAHNTQKGEYIGWIEETNRMALLTMERDAPDNTFNVKFLGDFRGSTYKSQHNKNRTESGRSERFGGTTWPTSTTTQPCDVVWMYVTLIPKEWELGPETYPEKWFFGVIGDKIVCTAVKLGLNHDMYPTAVAAPEFDGYSSTPIGRMEITYGMQHHLDFLMSSHMTNVRKAINDMLIVDPSLINMEDLKSPSPGKLIRMRKSAWGRGVENAVKQLQVVDITAKHMQDATQLIEMMRQTTGAQDVISGVRRQSSERVTATEASGDRNGALSRLAKAAKVVSLQALWDIGYMFASNTQQLMSKPVYVKTVGLWEDVLAKEYGIDAAMMVPQMNPRMLVNPKDLSVAYDLIIKDGSVMGGENPQVWAELFRTIASSPQLFQNFDVVRIFKHVARVMGAKDVNEFVLKAGPVQAQLMGDQQVASQAQAGNLVPVTQGGE
jgi:hypothetical protein